jgi:cytidylate kinase
MEELALTGKTAPLAEVLREIRERDARDAGRDVAPMKAADDAILVDSSTMTLDEVVSALERVVRERGG